MIKFEILKGKDRKKYARQWDEHYFINIVCGNMQLSSSFIDGNYFRAKEEAEEALKKFQKELGMYEVSKEKTFSSLVE